MKTYTCLHKVQYYETDQMGIVHHSNYIRWFEEARVSFMEEAGYAYDQMESVNKILCPVLEAQCTYKTMARFGETVEITAGISYTNGIRIRFTYEVRDAQTKELRATGYTLHCFINGKGSLVSLKKDAPDLYQLLAGYAEEVK